MPEILFPIRLFKNVYPGNIEIVLTIVNRNWTINITELKFRIKKRIKYGFDRIFCFDYIFMIRSSCIVFNINVKSVTGVGICLFC